MLFSIGNDPGNQDGGIVVDVDQEGAITFQYDLAEQGAAVCILDSGSVVVPGIDPIESWSFGNIYVDGTKKRTLPNVIHTFGACFHNGYLFVATGGHTGDEATFRGYVFRSDDLGDTWEGPIQVSNYRVYDIISFNGLLYVIANHFQDPFVAVSDDDGDSWEAVAGAVPEGLARMTVFGDLLIILSHDGDLIAINTAGELAVHDPPNYNSPINNRWNCLAVSGDYLYALCNDRLYRTDDFAGWEWHCNLERACTGLVVWPDFGLIVSEIGSDARLLRIPT